MSLNAGHDIIPVERFRVSVEVRVSDPQSQPAWEAILTDPALRLSDFEVACARLWIEGNDLYTIRDEVLADEVADAWESKSKTRDELLYRLYRQVKWAIEQTAERIQAAYTRQMREAAETDARAVDAARRNRKTFGESPRPLIGLHPLADIDRATWQAHLEALEDPLNYQEVSLRSPLVPEPPRLPAVEALQRLGEVFRAPVAV